MSWVLSLIEDLPTVPKQYFKKLVNTDEKSLKTQSRLLKDEKETISKGG
jgi:hypothetical protein